MSRCLDDRALLLIHDGEGGASGTAHVRTCIRCAGRYRRLVGDLKAIAQALRQAAAAARPRPGAGRRRAVAVAAALVAMLALVWVEGWFWRQSQLLVRPPAVAGDAEVLPFLAEVSAVLASAGEPAEAAPTLPPPAPGAEWLDAADEGE